MNYKCKDCGKVYEHEIDYCECGNNSFIKIPSKNDYDEKPEKESPLVYFMYIVFFTALFVGIFFLFKRIMTDINNREVEHDNYIETVLHSVFDGFSPEGIDKSGHCMVSFIVDETGNIKQKKIVESSRVYELDKKVYNSLKNVSNVGKPPVKYVNKTIKVDFICFAKKYEVECYSKNVVEP